MSKRGGGAVIIHGDPTTCQAKHQSSVLGSWVSSFDVDANSGWGG